MPRVYPRRPVMERIAARSVESDEGYATPCVLWTGAKGHNGYGIVTTGSQTDGTRKPARAHIAVWEHHYGPVPEGLELDHLCFVRACVNPAHLEAVTHAENRRRAAARKTHCPQGHAYEGENVFINSNGARVCRICSRAACRRSYRRNGRRKAA